MIKGDVFYIFHKTRKISMLVLDILISGCFLYLIKLKLFLEAIGPGIGLDKSMNGIPITKVCQYSHIKADATPVMNKSFEKLLSDNFQVIIFEIMAKNYFKVNT